MFCLRLLIQLLLLNAFIAIAYAEVTHVERFDEELVIRPLTQSHVNTYFQFTTRWHYVNRSNLMHTDLLPRSMAEILYEYDVKELNIALTQGLWRYEFWGYPIMDAAVGAEAWAWFSGKNLTSSTVDAQWAKLTSVFSGILCASLNFIDTSNSISPKFGFRPQHTTANAGQPNVRQHVRYATLPREIVCTENLTPWKKLLPCGSVHGFASLLNSGNVYNTKYHSLALKLRTACAKGDDENCILTLTQTANIVYDLKLLEGTSNDFSLRRLFGQGLNGNCVLATTSKIYVQTNQEGGNFQLTPPPQQELTTTRGGYTAKYALYDLSGLGGKREERLFNIAWVQRTGIKPNFLPLQPPLIYAHRFILGHGQERGRIVTEVTNTHYTALPIVVQELIPWFVATYLHTLRVHPKLTSGVLGAAIPIKQLHYVPSKQRKSPTHIELAIELPAKTTAQISIEFEYQLLKWLEYPPDANHGHYIGAAVVSTQLPIARNYSLVPVEGALFLSSFNATCSTGYYQTLRTESLIVSLPTPDFSMPYNVICLACTVVALAFGPIHSVATKRIVIDRDERTSKSKLTTLFNKIFKRKQSNQASEEVLEQQQEQDQEQTPSEMPDAEDVDSPENVN